MNNRIRHNIDHLDMLARNGKLGGATRVIWDEDGFRDEDESILVQVPVLPKKSKIKKTKKWLVDNQIWFELFALLLGVLTLIIGLF